MAKLATFTKKNLEATKAHDLRLHPDKLRAWACPCLHIQKTMAMPRLYSMLLRKHKSHAHVQDHQSSVLYREITQSDIF
jgi:hypothetical protein